MLNAAGTVETLDLLSRSRALTEAESLLLECAILRPYPTIAEVQSRVCARFHLLPIYMQSAQRHRDIARPRQVAMYLCCKLTLKTLPEIGRRFGGRDHTTVIHARKTIERLRLTDPAIAAAVDELTKELAG